MYFLNDDYKSKVNTINSFSSSLSLTNRFSDIVLPDSGLVKAPLGCCFLCEYPIFSVNYSRATQLNCYFLDDGDTSNHSPIVNINVAYVFEAWEYSSDIIYDSFSIDMSDYSEGVYLYTFDYMGFSFSVFLNCKTLFSQTQPSYFYSLGRYDPYTLLYDRVLGASTGANFEGYPYNRYYFYSIRYFDFSSYCYFSPSDIDYILSIYNKKIIT
jgi:hypothetical protein